MQPTLYGPDGHALRPSAPPPPPLKYPPSARRKWARGTAPAPIGLAKKSETNPSAEDRAILSSMELAVGTDRCLPVWFGRGVLGYVKSARGSNEAKFFRRRPWDKALPLGAAGIASYDDIIAAMAAGQSYKQQFTKSNTGTVVANNYYDLFGVGGNPTNGSISGTALTFVQCSDTTAGALYMNGNVEPTYHKFMTLSSSFSSAGTPSLIVYDRVGHYPACAFSASSQNFVNTLTAQRYNGTGLPGCWVATTNAAALGATAANFSAFTYTNGAGTTGQSIITTRANNVIVSAAVPSTTVGARFVSPCDSGATVLWNQYLPLASGDTGVRALSAYTCSAANTGTLCFVLLREMMLVPMGTAGVPTQIDNIFQIGGLDRVYDGACLALQAYFPAATSATFNGYSKTVWN